MPRPKVLTLAPVASDPNGLGTSFTLAAASLELPLDGTLASGYDVNGLFLDATIAGAGAITLDGALTGGGKASFSTSKRVCIEGGSNESGKTFTVVGWTKRSDVPGTAYATEVITGPNATQVFGAVEFDHIDSITASAGTTGNIQIGVQGSVSLTTPQHISITSAGDDSGDTFTVTGTDREGRAITEDITGGAATVALGTKNFKTVTKVVSDGASAAGVEVGVDGLCESRWFVLDSRNPSFNVGLGVDISSGASLTYDVEHTFNDVLASTFVEGSGTVFNHETLAGQTTNGDGNYTNPPVATRLAITTHTSGSANLRVIQTGTS